MNKGALVSVAIIVISLSIIATMLIVFAPRNEQASISSSTTDISNISTTNTSEQTSAGISPQPLFTNQTGASCINPAVTVFGSNRTARPCFAFALSNSTYVITTGYCSNFDYENINITSPYTGLLIPAYCIWPGSFFQNETYYVTMKDQNSTILSFETNDLSINGIISYYPGVELSQNTYTARVNSNFNMQKYGNIITLSIKYNYQTQNFYSLDKKTLLVSVTNPTFNTILGCRIANYTKCTPIR